MRRLWVHAVSVIMLGWLGQTAGAQPPKLPQPVPSPDATTQEPAPVGDPAGQPLGQNGTVVLNGDCGCRRPGHWTIGGGMYYIMPSFESNPAFRINSGVTSQSQREIDWDLKFAPLGFLSYEGDNGWGIRGRWMQFDSSADTSFTNTAGTSVTTVNPLGVFGATGATNAVVGTRFDATHDLSFYMYDVEGSHSFQSGAWNLLMSGGVRYGHIGQSFRLTATGLDTTVGTLTSRHTFTGIGPTFNVESKRRLWETGIFVYGNARGSLLFGQSKQNASVTTVTGGGALGTASTTNGAEQNDVLPIGELEIGSEYGRDIGRFRLFGQAGFVGQVWWGAGNAANVDGAFGGSGNNNNANMGLLGLVLRTGVSF